MDYIPPNIFISFITYSWMDNQFSKNFFGRFRIVLQNYDIYFNLSSISENKTEITVEIRRKVGSFDQSHEITNANKHIEAIVDNLSKGIMLTDVDI